MNNQPDQLDQALDDLLFDPQRYYIQDADGNFVEYDMNAGLQLLKPDIKLLLLKARKEELRLACENWEKNPTKPASYMIDRTDELKSLAEEMKGVEG